ncbi:hypothetical protein ACHAXR_001936, partial [Thalassiosira sp. AJA248-18]
MIKVKPFLSLLAVASVKASNLRGGDSTYKAGIVSAIAELKEHRGSSPLSIRNHMEANMPAGKSWNCSSFTRALKQMVADGDLDQDGDAYKWSPDFRRRVKTEAAASYETKPAPKVDGGDLVKTKASYKLSAEFEQKAAAASKPKKAHPKKKAAP